MRVLRCRYTCAKNVCQRQHLYACEPNVTLCVCCSVARKHKHTYSSSFYLDCHSTPVNYVHALACSVTDNYYTFSLPNPSRVRSTKHDTRRQLPLRITTVQTGMTAKYSLFERLFLETTSYHMLNHSARGRRPCAHETQRYTCRFATMMQTSTRKHMLVPPAM